MTPNEKIVVTFEVAGNNAYQTTKNINEFLRNSYREFAASSSIIDYEVIDGRICTGCGNNHLNERKPL